MNQVSLDEALQLQDKTIVNVICTIETAEIKTGPKSTYWNCRVADGGTKAYLNIFGNSPNAFVGKRVVLCGCEVDSWNNRKKLSLSKRGSIMDFNPDLEAAPRYAHTSPDEPDGKAQAVLDRTRTAQKPPQNRPAAPTHTQTASRGLEHYTVLYVACLGAARKTCSDASFADDPETVRQIATAFFIQGLKDNIPVDPSVPF